MLLLRRRGIYLRRLDETAFDLSVGALQRHAGEDSPRTKGRDITGCRVASAETGHCFAVEFRHEGAGVDLGADTSGNIDELAARRASRVCISKIGPPLLRISRSSTRMWSMRKGSRNSTSRTRTRRSTWRRVRFSGFH